ncbi:MAG: hypothetical protein WAQ33_03520 [Gaiellaceae bacterium]
MSGSPVLIPHLDDPVRGRGCLFKTRRYAFCASLDNDGRAALHDAYRRRLDVTGGPFELTARAWAVAGIVR